MPHRQFVDREGRSWEVWEVHPEYAERRSTEPIGTPREDERRRRDEFRVPLDPKWSKGWLCFQAAQEKRRFAPIPEAWASFSDQLLAELCEHADPAPRSRRLVE